MHLDEAGQAGLARVGGRRERVREPGRASRACVAVKSKVGERGGRKKGSEAACAPRTAINCGRPARPNEACARSRPLRAVVQLLAALVQCAELVRQSGSERARRNLRRRARGPALFGCALGSSCQRRRAEGAASARSRVASELCEYLRSSSEPRRAEKGTSAGERQCGRRSSPRSTSTGLSSTLCRSLLPSSTLLGAPIEHCQLRPLAEPPSSAACTSRRSPVALFPPRAR